MKGLLRKLAINLCTPIYQLIPQIYNIFYILSNHRFFEDDTIDRLSSNIYVLVSVVMLFAFSANILAAIVNPDLMNDKKKGVGAMFKRAIIGLALIVIIPFAFDEAYVIQREVVSKNLIEKVVVGVNYDSGECTNGGQVIAGTLIASVLYPSDDEVQINADIQEYYETMVKTDIKAISKVENHINITKDSTSKDEDYLWTNNGEDYAFTFDGLIALVAGLVCCYLLLTFAIDMAVRIFKLAFLELTVPIIVIAYMSAGDDILKKWFKETLRTFLDVFVRIACMAFFIFLVGHLDGFLNNIADAANLAETDCEVKNFGIIDMFFLKVLLIIGMLIFVKQIPDFVNKVFGVSIQSKGGIKGRLGEMAVGGKLAQGAWNIVKNGALLGMGGLALTPGLAPFALGAFGVKKGLGLLERKFPKTDKHKFANADLSTFRKIGGFAKTVPKVAGAFANDNILKAIPEASKTYKETKFAKDNAISKEEKDIERKRNSANINPLGKIRQLTPAEVAAGQTKLGISRIGIDQLIADIEKDSKLTYDGKKAIKGKIVANEINSLAQRAKTADESIRTQFDTMIANSINDPQLNSRLQLLKDGYMNGNMKLENITSELKLMAESGRIGPADANNIIVNANKLNGVAKIMNDSNSVLGKFVDENNIDSFISDGSVNSTKVATFASDSQTYMDMATEKYKKSSESANVKEKTILDNYDKVQGYAVSEYIKLATPVKGNASDGYFELTDNSGGAAPSGGGAPSGGAAPSGGTAPAGGAAPSGGAAPAGGAAPSGGGDSQTIPDLSQYFDELSKNIKDANKETNKILNEQLDTQRSIESESKKSNTNLNNIKNSVDGINDKLDNGIKVKLESSDDE